MAIGNRTTGRTGTPATLKAGHLARREPSFGKRQGPVVGPVAARASRRASLIGHDDAPETIDRLLVPAHRRAWHGLAGRMTVAWRLGRRVSAAQGRVAVRMANGLGRVPGRTVAAVRELWVRPPAPADLARWGVRAAFWATVVVTAAVVAGAGVVRWAGLQVARLGRGLAGVVRLVVSGPVVARAAATAYGLIAGVAIALLVASDWTGDEAMAVAQGPVPITAPPAVAVAAVAPVSIPKPITIPDVHRPTPIDIPRDKPAATPAPAPATASDQLAWQRHAVAAQLPHDRPRVVVGIDDLGLNRPASRAVAALPGPLTLAYLPYASDLERQTAAARGAGHELLVHMPMEPERGGIDPGPMALTRDASPAELDRRINWNLTRFDGFVGINNHMGSRLTAHRPQMTRVLRTLKARGLLYLDSRTSARTVGASVAGDLAVPFAERDIFLDNERTPAAVRAQLRKLERKAHRDGSAIAIGHPYPETVAVLTQWLASLDDKGLVLAPLSAVVRERMRPTAVAVHTGTRGRSQP